MSSSQMILSTAQSLGNLKNSIVSEERKLLLFSWTINCSSLPILSNKKLSPASPPEDHVSKARSAAWEVMETSQSRARFCMFQVLEEHSLRELWDLTLPPASCLGLPCVLLWHTVPPQAESNVVNKAWTRTPKIASQNEPCRLISWLSRGLVIMTEVWLTFYVDI